MPKETKKAAKKAVAKEKAPRAPRPAAKLNATTGGFAISDALWEKLAPLLPAPENTHRFGGGRPRTPDRQCAEAIFFVLRTGCQWNALSATGLCASSTAHDRFQQWRQAGVFERFWQAGLLAYDELRGLDWEWLAMDGAMTKAPLGGGEGKKHRPQPHRPRQRGRQAQPVDRGGGHPGGPGHRRGQPPRHEAGESHAGGRALGAAGAHP